MRDLLPEASGPLGAPGEFGIQRNFPQIPGIFPASPSGAAQDTLTKPWFQHRGIRQD